MAKHFNCKYIETSAKDRFNVEEAFSNLVREINHKGKYFDVPGPHICQPSPQRTPLIYQAGTSKAGKAFAAKHAEAIFVSQHSPAATAGPVADVRRQAREFGRDPYDIKVLAKFAPVIMPTLHIGLDAYAAGALAWLIKHEKS